MARQFYLWLIALIVLLATLVTASSPAQARGWSCFKTYHATCYAPAKVSEAERAMAVRPVNPDRAVVQATHLPLVRVIVEQDVVTHGAGRVIFYSFGTALSLDRPMAKKSKSSLFVTEFVLPKVATHGGLKFQPGTIPSVLASFPHRKLALLIGGPFPRQLLLHVARSILAH